MASPPATEAPTADPYAREPFRHPALTNIDKLSQRQPKDVFSVDKIADFASQIGTTAVMRWKPRLVRLSPAARMPIYYMLILGQPENLESSGIGVVLNQVVFAIVGAISLQHGADVASKFVRDRILRRLK